MNVDTVGLWFTNPGATGREKEEPVLLAENNLEKCQSSAALGSELAFLGEVLRSFVDPTQVSGAMRLLNPSILSTVSMLLPDAKYDIALVQETFEVYSADAPYNAPGTGWLDKIRGSPHLCYLSQIQRGSFCSHLLKTQERVDENRVQYYTDRLAKALADKSAERPTALVLDFFNNGQIHAVQPDEDDSNRGPGGRRLQTRRKDACEKDYMDNQVAGLKSWILLDGHHKVEAAARLGCSINFLVISPCAEPYEPLLDTDECAPLLCKALAFPLLWPSGAGPLVVEWEAARLCAHSPMVLSSSRAPSEAWCDKRGCPCFHKDDTNPRWAIDMVRVFNGNVSKGEVHDFFRQQLGDGHELFSAHFRTDLYSLEEDLKNEMYGMAFSHWTMR